MRRFRQQYKRASNLVLAGLLISISVFPVVKASAAETGGYPWADAVAVHAQTYDWGYAHCLPAIQQASACGYTRARGGLTYYVGDPWRYALRNCTSYVAWRVSHEFGLGIPGWGNANTWDDAARRAGYRVDNSPAVGAIAVWEGYYGHVAFVVGVNQDGSANIEQYNRAGTGTFSRESRVRANHYIYLGVQKPAAPAAAPTPAPAPAPAPVPVPAPPKPLVDPPLRQVPLPSAAKPNPLASTEDTDYLVALDPKTRRTNVYAVQYNNTTSGRVEIHKSDNKTGNSVWESSLAAPELMHSKDLATYALADHDADGQLDLYQIKYDQNTSGHTEVQVFSGASSYKKQLGAWPTSEVTHSPAAASYSVADYNGDGALDIYKLDKPTPTTKLTVKILDGKKGYNEPATKWESEDQPANQQQAYTVGDYDRDGKADVYQIARPEDVSPTPANVDVRVFSAATNYLSSSSSWRLAPETTKTSQ